MKNLTKEQFVPIFLTVSTFIFLVIFLFYVVLTLNHFAVHEKILLKIRAVDILVGLTVYLKTSVDFALFIANLMKTNNGWRKRISIELGTAFGNALGTLLILIIWVFFKDVPLLLAFMIFLASIVLLKMAQEGIEDFQNTRNISSTLFNKYIDSFLFTLKKVNKIFNPIIGHIIPSSRIINAPEMKFWRLLFFSLTIPFILGLDGFAGYIPVFSVVNVFCFCIGVFLGHMLLNIFLFLSPKRTIRAVENRLILLLGSGAFIIISVYGFYEVFNIISKILHF